MKYAPIILTVLFASAGSACADDAAKMLAEARGLFDRANELRFSAPQSASELYSKSAKSFESISRKCGLKNGRLLYDTGNAYFLSGDLGRAILSYRRARSLIPRDVNLQQNLEYARSRRVDKIPSPRRNKPMKTLLFWHYDLAVSTRRAIFAVAYLAFWLLATWRICRPQGPPRWTLITCAAVSILLACSVVIERNSTGRADQGVVIAAEVVARKGDSQAYQPSFDSPLHAGTEFSIIARRGEWLEVQLTDGRKCWIPSSAGAAISPWR